MSAVNVKLPNADSIVKAAHTSAQIHVQTSKVLESLLSTSSALREEADKAVAGLEGAPRTKALEDVLRKG